MVYGVCVTSLNKMLHTEFERMNFRCLIFQKMCKIAFGVSMLEFFCV